MKAGAVFNDYAKTPAEPSNHGKRWTDEMVRELVRLFLRGATAQRLCDEMGRTRDSVLAKLVDQQLLIQDAYGSSAYAYRITNKAQRLARELFEPTGVGTPTETTPETNPETTKENTMTTIATIENRTLINGNNGADMSDEELFVVIAKLEERKRKFEAIVTKPNKLVEAIAKLDTEIAAVAAYVDAR